MEEPKIENAEDNEDILETAKSDWDPYAYLKRGDFSSENYKIEIKNLPKFYGIREFKKLLNDKLKLNSNKIKIPRQNSPYAFVCFRNDIDRDNAINVISQFKWKGKELQATYAKASADPLVRKRKEEFEDTNPEKKQKTDDLSQEEKVKLSTIPLADLDYEEQLKNKEKEIKTILKRLGNDLSHYNIELRKWIEKQKEKYNGLPCELMNIRYSEFKDEYRNKCEFTIGVDQETNLPIVGFRIGSYVNGEVEVAPVHNLKHIPNSMKIAVDLFQQFVRSSKLQVFNPELHSGHFRQLCIRIASEQLMLIVGIHPQDLGEDQITEFKEQLVDYFANGEGKKAMVTSLYYQEIVKKNPGENSTPAVLLWGDSHIYETILGLKFRISPEAFFQINTKAAEILYNSVIELAEPTETSTMVDVCCGTGTIGLCFANKCRQILGLEIVPEAIVDAKENAVINNITNSEFFAGKAQEILGSVCFRSGNDDVFAVVDPPRAGLHKNAVLQLRKITKINRLVYVSCNPKLARKNFIDLGRPISKTLHGECFVPVKAVAVDMFPHTNHCELVISFKRWDSINKEENKDLCIS
ncbi:tRNA (uracil-5-)-methyltransferase homolog A [Rhynchophorus ferrugineus]|uniref:tRNA (uracil-5-)-methyltransferase homolog A n=1 Tax=Rhynchophorus ferrugineus TaxID=354439 RepID=UPI003FCE9C52